MLFVRHLVLILHLMHNFKMASPKEKPCRFDQGIIHESGLDHSENPHKQKYIQPYGVDGIEDLEGYREGGLHPVDILDILDGRFEVCHKLGSGGISTVWLCYEAARKRWRAIKINAASESSEDSAELRIGQFFEEKAVTARQLEMHHIILAEETFWIKGPNGKHLCSVLPVLGPTVQHWRCITLGLSAARINKVCYEITEGLDFLHEHGICHADFRPQNILMRLADGGLDHLDPDDLFGIISLPRRHEVQTLDGSHSSDAPNWVVEPLRWFELEGLVLDSAAIVDFGEAFEVTKIPKFLGIPRTYASPEVTYGEEPVGTESDVWSLALTLIEVRTGLKLGEIPNSPLNRMESFAGPIPPPYRSLAAKEMYQDEVLEYEAYGEKGMTKPQPLSEEMLNSTRSLTSLFWDASQGERASYSDTNNSSDGIEDVLGRELYEKVVVPKEENMNEEEIAIKMMPYRIPAHELTRLADLLRRMLKYKPGERLSTSGVLKHPWFKMGLEDGQFDTDEAYNTEEPFDHVLCSEGRGLHSVGEEAQALKSKTNMKNRVDTRNRRTQALFPIPPGQMLLCLSVFMPILISFIVLWGC
ncbi:kinase-like domain-containing protein [Xylaria sp. FL0064]|nr:kinase-like domain-containing protein [Xylaria sp. FL0064]